MKNICPFYIVFQVLKVLLIKISKIRPPDLLFLVFLLGFTLADIISHKFLELHQYLPEKIFVTIFFSWIQSTPSSPLTTKIC